MSSCPNLRVVTGIMVTYKDIRCSCKNEKIDVEYMKAVCKCDYTQCNRYKAYGICNSGKK